jgi:hypothetical protein
MLDCWRRSAAMPFERRKKSRYRRNGLKELGTVIMNGSRIDIARNVVKLRGLPSK